MLKGSRPKRVLIMLDLVSGAYLPVVLISRPLYTVKPCKKKRKKKKKESAGVRFLGFGDEAEGRVHKKS